MQPGENRWIGLRFPAAAGNPGQVLAVHFHELVDGVPVNGFAVGARLMPLEAVIHEKLQRHRSQLTRLAASGVAGAEKSAAEAAKLAKEKTIAPEAYVRFVSAQLGELEAGIGSVGAAGRGFNLPGALESLEKAIKADDAGAVTVSHDCLLNRLDSALTMQHVAGGDVANILHNVRWQQDLLRTGPKLGRVECRQELEAASGAFVQAYGERKRTNRDYPKFLRSQLECLLLTARTLQDDALSKQAELVEKSIGGDLAKLQRAHQDYLQRLEALGGR
jgi:hypothetical protein